jgi:twitching motility two-component system response regulator PilG
MRGTQRRFRNGSNVSFQALGMDRSNRANQTVSVSATTGVDTVSIPSSGLKVLVIDDSNTIRRSAEIFLKQGGHDVMLAEDGFDALSKVNDYEPDLIFCDILMPRLDGYQTCAIIKRNARFSDVPLVMLSSKDGVFDKARGRMVGSQDYLTKPFTKDQLLQTVHALGTVKQREE